MEEPGKSLPPNATEKTRKLKIHRPKFADTPEVSNPLLYGHVSLMGRRRDMEDAVTVAPPELEEEGYSFFAVYDGHGGVKVAERCQEKMQKFVARNVKKVKTEEDGALDRKNVMRESFRDMKVEIERECKRNETGSTATVVLVGKEEHQPYKGDEEEKKKERIGVASRSLGDGHLKPYVCSEPEVSVVKRSGTDELLIIATNGLFDVVSNEIACDVVKQYLRVQLRRGEEEGSRVSMAAAKLAELAIAKGSKDNISVIIIQLNEFRLFLSLL